MDPCDATPERAFDLGCDALAPWLWRVSWRGDAPAAEGERELLAQVARSRESGALIVLVPRNGPPDRLPEALRPLTGATVAALEVAALPPAEECGALRLFAPRGRGRVVMAAQHATAGERLLTLLQSKAAFARAQAHLDATIAAFAEQDGWQPLPRRRRALDDGLLVPAAATARAFDHSASGGELFVEMAECGATATPVAGRLVRGGESFTLRLARGGRPLEKEQLVLVRATAPADRGALLRVELDDEDLGPWRLGDTQARERVSFDLFRISSDLLAGRERVRLAFRLDGRTEVAALRWWFLTEEEQDGLWLTELEPARTPGTHEPAVRAADRAADGGLLAHDDELFLRGVALAPGRAVRYVLPRGERRLEALVAPARAPAAGGELTVTAGGATTRLPMPAGNAARRELHATVRGDELVLGVGGDTELLLLAPKLLR